MVKVKSLTTDEIGLNDTLAARRHPRGRDGLRGADPATRRRLVVAHPRAGDPPKSQRDSRSLPAHDRARTSLGRAGTSQRPRARYLREKFLARAGSVSAARTSALPRPDGLRRRVRGQRRMCTDAAARTRDARRDREVVPTLRDLEVFLQLLPRSSTGERMNPYTSLWTGRDAGDGPQEFHVVLLDNGRTRVLADAVGRQALHCIRCGACLNACPVYRTGGHAYGSVTRADRRDPDAAALGSRERRVAAVRLVSVRRLLRGLSGEDRHSASAAAPAHESRDESSRSPERTAMGLAAWTFGEQADSALRSASAGSRRSPSRAAA